MDIFIKSLKYQILRDKKVRKMNEPFWQETLWHHLHLSILHWAILSWAIFLQFQKINGLLIVHFLKGRCFQYYVLRCTRLFWCTVESTLLRTDWGVCHKELKMYTLIPVCLHCTIWHASLFSCRRVGTISTTSHFWSKTLKKGSSGDREK